MKIDIASYNNIQADEDIKLADITNVDDDEMIKTSFPNFEKIISQFI